MQLNNNQAAAQLPSGIEVTTAKISMSAHMADMLSSRIYTDKIAAVIREISCNGYDAQVVAGNESTALDVHLPTRFEPWFSVRDYGLGLNETDLMNMYMTYGESTKQNSDTQVGAFGIGSKSPFAYTNGFSVRSIHAGQVTEYSVFKDSGIPTCAKLTQKVSNEPSGLEVKMPVSVDDQRQFLETARRIYNLFSVKPNLNLPLGDYDEVLVDSDDFTVYRNFSGYSSSLYAVMGQVRYEISHKRSHELLGLTEGDVYLKFALGEISPAPSREHLENDDKTLDAIDKKITLAIDKLILETQEKVDKCESVWEARVLAKTLLPVGHHMIDYRGMKFEEYIGLVQNQDLDRVSYCKDSYYSGGCLKYDEIPKHRINKDTTILSPDVKGAIGDFRRHARHNHGSVHIVANDHADALKIAKMYQLPEKAVIKASSIKTVKSKTGSKKKAQAVLLGQQENKTVPVDLEEIKKPFYVVNTNRGEVVRTNFQKRLVSPNMVFALMNAGILGSVFCLTTSQCKKLKNKNAIFLNDAYMERFVTQEHRWAYKLGEVVATFKASRRIAEIFGNNIPLTDEQRAIQKVYNKIPNKIIKEANVLETSVFRAKGHGLDRFRFSDNVLKEMYPFLTLALDTHTWDELKCSYIKKMVALADKGLL